MYFLLLLSVINDDPKLENGNRKINSLLCRWWWWRGKMAKKKVSDVTRCENSWLLSFTNQWLSAYALAFGFKVVVVIIDGASVVVGRIVVVIITIGAMVVCLW